MTDRLIKKIIEDQEIVTAPADMTVSEAALLMREKHIGAVIVVENTRLAGIFTERDALFRVVAEGRDSKTTRLADVMTRNPQTVRQVPPRAGRGRRPPRRHHFRARRAGPGTRSLRLRIAAPGAGREYSGVAVYRASRCPPRANQVDCSDLTAFACGPRMQHMITRRRVVLALGAAALAPHASFAQQQKIYRIGFLSAITAGWSRGFARSRASSAPPFISPTSRRSLGRMGRA